MDRIITLQLPSRTIYLPPSKLTFLRKGSGDITATTISQIVEHLVLDYGAYLVSKFCKFL